MYTYSKRKIDLVILGTTVSFGVICLREYEQHGDQRNEGIVMRFFCSSVAKGRWPMINYFKLGGGLC